MRMSQENVDTVRRSCDAFDRGDYEASLAELDPHIRFVDSSDIARGVSLSAEGR